MRELTAGSWIDSTALHVMRDECLAHDTFTDLGSAIVTKMMQTVETAYMSELDITFPTPALRQAKLGLASMKFGTFKADNPLELSASNVVYAQILSIWTLRIVIGDGLPMMYRVTIDLSWTVPREDRDPQPQARVESSGKEGFPYYHWCRHIANFIESKPHASFDMMAYEASQIAFTACERGLGPRQVQAVRLAVSDLGPEQPAKGTTYNIKRSWNFDSGWYCHLNRAQNKTVSNGESHRALIALGSNIGDRIGMVEQACIEMAQQGLKPLRTSSLYETEPMYKTDQPSFVNGVCEVSRRAV